MTYGNFFFYLVRCIDAERAQESANHRDGARDVGHDQKVHTLFTQCGPSLGRVEQATCYGLANLDLVKTSLNETEVQAGHS